MQPAFISLLLFAVHVSVLVDCRLRPRDPEQRPPQQQQQSSFYPVAHADTSAAMGHFYMELSGPKRRGIHKDPRVILPVKTDRTNSESIFDLRRKRFLCISLKGETYNSRLMNKEGCLFQRIWLNLMNHQRVFYSTSGGQLLKMKRAELRTAHREPPEPSSALLDPLTKRQRRSEGVNPSDPLRSQSHPSYFARDHNDPSHRQPDQDQAGAVSKETIASCDDPLRVLQSNGPVSPVKTNIAKWAEQH